MATEIVSQDTPFVKDNSLIRVDFINDETPVVSSLDVARHFQKKHKHVLEEIRKIISNTPEPFTGPNFRPSEYTDPTGRKLIAYQLTRDGFCLLVMGFTGQVALQWPFGTFRRFMPWKMPCARTSALPPWKKASVSSAARTALPSPSGP